MALTSRVSFELSALLTGPGDFGAPSSSPRFARQVDLASGTGAGQADRIWTDQRSIAASSDEDLDLAASLTDAFGATITFAKVKALYIAAAAANTNNVVVGGHASAAWSALFGDATDTLVLRPGAFFLLACPTAAAYAVTATTADLLQVANSSSGSAVVYEVAIIGTSA